MKQKSRRYTQVSYQDYSITVKFSSSSELQKGCELLSNFNCTIKVSAGQNLTLSSPPSELANCQSQEDKLTKRELEVLLFLAKGYSYSESASLLGCCTSTIQTHVKSLYRKLNVNSKTEAVYEAIQLNLLDL